MNPALTLVLDPRTTTFVFLDFQNAVLPRIERPEEVIGRAASVLEAARAAGAGVVFVRVAFRPGYPEVNDRNAMGSAVKAMGGLLLDSPATQIVDSLAPLATEPVVVKHRVGAFAGTDLAQIVRARSSETLVLLGVATSGAVLSTLRYAADEDYRVVVVEDGCADADAEVHRVLMEKVFPRQATVARAEAVAAAIARLVPGPERESSTG